MSVHVIDDRVTVTGAGDPGWLRAVGVVPADERSGQFRHEVDDPAELDGLRNVESVADWAASQNTFGPATKEGVLLAGLDPHPPLTTAPRIVWTARDGTEVDGPVEWHRGLGYLLDTPVDVLWSQGDDCWVTVADTSPLARRGQRIIDVPFGPMYRGRTAFWAPRAAIGPIAPYRMTVAQAGPAEILRGRYACVNGSWRPVDGSNAAVLGDERVPLVIQTVSPLPERVGDEFVFALRAPRDEDEIGGSRTVGSVAVVEGEDVEVAEPYSSWNGTDVLRVFSDGLLGATADDGFDRRLAERAGRQIASVRSFEVEVVRTVPHDQ
ncbi:hypothetical protein [Curtobacterium pusillum]|uniref:hypothetical protein n=1 Tax=Curtobacterium pusillum TaxID=69373 RepID=UPI0011AA00E2|nr:hypothetical protein [Curtobacterium pusillum]